MNQAYHTFQIGDDIWTINFIDKPKYVENFDYAIDNDNFIVTFVKGLNIQKLLKLFRLIYTRLLAEKYIMKSELDKAECVTFAADNAMQIFRASNEFYLFLVGGNRDDSDGRLSRGKEASAEGKEQESKASNK